MSLKVDNLSFSYGNKLILNKITSNFNPGEITVIAGPNGSGKTTLVKSIMDLLKVEKNSIFLDNKDVHSYHILEKSRLLGYVSQNAVYDFDFSVFEIVEMGRYAYKKQWDTTRDKLAIDNALKITDTYIYKDRSINSLSGGELQRVLLARALAGEPKNLILDEPSSNLDIAHNIEIMELLRKLTKEYNLTTIIVLHDLNTMLTFGDKIVLLNNGDIKFQGDIKNVLIPENIKKIYGINTQLIQDINGRSHIIIV